MRAQRAEGEEKLTGELEAARIELTEANQAEIQSLKVDFEEQIKAIKL